MYKATSIDTDKALAAIEAFRHTQSLAHQKELYGAEKYYEGVEKGLELAESLFNVLVMKKMNPNPFIPRFNTTIVSIRCRNYANEWQSWNGS